MVYRVGCHARSVAWPILSQTITISHFLLPANQGPACRKGPRPVLQPAAEWRCFQLPSTYSGVCPTKRKASRYPRSLSEQPEDTPKSKEKIIYRDDTSLAHSHFLRPAQQPAFLLAFAKAIPPILNSGHFSTSPFSELAALSDISLDTRSLIHIHTESCYF